MFFRVQANGVRRLKNISKVKFLRFMIQNVKVELLSFEMCFSQIVFRPSGSWTLQKHFKKELFGVYGLGINIKTLYSTNLSKPRTVVHSVHTYVNSDYFGSFLSSSTFICNDYGNFHVDVLSRVSFT